MSLNQVIKVLEEIETIISSQNFNIDYRNIKVDLNSKSINSFTGIDPINNMNKLR